MEGSEIILRAKNPWRGRMAATACKWARRSVSPPEWVPSMDAPGSGASPAVCLPREALVPLLIRVQLVITGVQIAALSVQEFLFPLLPIDSLLNSGEPSFALFPLLLLLSCTNVVSGVLPAGRFSCASREQGSCVLHLVVFQHFLFLHF